MPPLTRAACDAGLAPQVFSTVREDIVGGSAKKGIGGSSFLTEFGAQTPDLSKPDDEETVQLLAVLAEADRHLQSWTYWDIGSLVNGSTGFNMDHMGAFVRAYAQAVAGTPTRMRYDPHTRVFLLEYRQVEEPDAHGGQPTEIFVPQYAYPHGFEVATSSDLQHQMGCDPLRPRGTLR